MALFAGMSSYKKLPKKELEKLKDKVCLAALEVYKTLKHNNIKSVTIWDLERALKELFDDESISR